MKVKSCKKEGIVDRLGQNRFPKLTLTICRETWIICNHTHCVFKGGLTDITQNLYKHVFLNI